MRFRQLRRWARGHTQVLFRHLRPILVAPGLRLGQRLDGTLLLLIYMVPPILLGGLAASLWLFLAGKVLIGPSILISFFAIGYNAFGNFAPFYQVGIAGLLDGMRERLLLLPYLFFLFLFNSAAVTMGVMDAVVDIVSRRAPVWEKTRRFRQ